MTEEERIEKMREIRLRFWAHDLTGSASVGIDLLKQWAELCGHTPVLRALPNFIRFLNEDES